MANDVLKQLTWQFSDPMLFVAQQCFCIAWVTQIIGIIALHVYRRSPKVTTLHQCSHSASYVAELVVVPDRQFQALAFRQGHELLRLLCEDSERLFNVDVTTMLETGPSNFK